jgi:hypothetical protein
VRYRLAFEKRLRSDGQESSIDPTSKLDDELDDGVVAEKVFVERLEPQAQHSQEVLDEDDAFLALASTEVWEYDVVNDRIDEFEDAIRNSRVVFEYTVVDESETPEEDLAGQPTGDRGAEGVPSSRRLADDQVEGIRAPDESVDGTPKKRVRSNRPVRTTSRRKTG